MGKGIQWECIVNVTFWPLHVILFTHCEVSGCNLMLWFVIKSIMNTINIFILCASCEIPLLLFTLIQKAMIKYAMDMFDMKIVRDKHWNANLRPWPSMGMQITNAHK